MSDFQQKYRKPYYGRVLDGPFEGEWIEHDEVHFVGYPFVRYEIRLFNDVEPVAGHLERVVYKWLSSYRAWAWMQPRARPPESDAALRTRIGAHPDVARNVELARWCAIAIGVELDKLGFMHGIERYLPPGTPRPDISVGRSHTGRIADALAFCGDQFGGFKS